MTIVFIFLASPHHPVLMSDELWAHCEPEIYERIEETHVLNNILTIREDLFAREPIVKSLSMVSFLRVFMPVSVAKKVQHMEILWERNQGNIAQFQPWMAEHRSASILFLKLVSV